MNAETVRDENRWVGTTVGLAHEALLYRGADELVAAIVPFVRDALAAGEPVLVALPAPNLNLLAAALDDAALDDAALHGPALHGPALGGAGLGGPGLGGPGPTLGGARLGESVLGESVLGESVLGGPAPSEPALGRAALGGAVLGESALNESALGESVLGGPAPSEPALGGAALGGAVLGGAALGGAAPGGAALGGAVLGGGGLGESGRGCTVRGEVALGEPASRLRLVDMTEAGRNPGRIIPWVLHAFIQEHAGKRVRIVGESVWAGRTAEEYPACAQHEALVNVTLAGCAATILCPFDASRLDPHVLTDAGRTHPVVAGDGRRWCSAEYRPESVIGAYDQPLPDVPAGAAAVEFDGTGLAELRDLVADRARRAGMTERRVVDLQLAVNELVSNAVLHGAGSGTLWMWTVAGGVACEVRDHGRALVPLAGRVPPGPGSVRGRGLVLVNYVSDLVRIHTRPDGTAIRLYMRF